MEIKQIYELTNNAVKSIIGETAVLNEDLSNLVDVGTALENIDDENKYKNFVTGLVDRIGRVVFVIRKYNGSAPSVLMDAWTYGSIKSKIWAELPEAQENESWELVDGASYDEDIYKGTKAHQKFYNKRTTFEVQISVTDEQIRSAFTSAEEMNGFLSMIYNEVDKALTIRVDGLIKRTINNFIAETIHHDYGSDGLDTKTGVRAINLLKMYNDEHSDATLTKEEAYTNPAFIRYACYVMKYTADNLAEMSTLHNIGATPKFTPRDYLKVVMLSRFKAGADVFLQSETFHNELTKFPEADSVACWQGTGTSFALADVSKISVKTTSGDEVETDGILAVMFDREALGVSCYNRKITSKYNNRAEFTNLWYKQMAGYFNDFNENFVVFFIQ